MTPQTSHVSRRNKTNRSAFIPPERQDHMHKALKTGLAVVFVLPWLAFFALLVAYNRSGMSRGDLGQLGDYFGGLLNPLIAYGGLTALILSAVSATRQISEASKSSTEAQRKHTEALAQSSAIGLLQAFMDATRTARLGSSESERHAVRTILQLDDPNDSETVAACASTLAITWGGPARCLYLLYATSQLGPFNAASREAAVATLSGDELEYLILTLALIAPDIAQQLAAGSAARTSSGLVRATGRIANRVERSQW